VLCEVSKDTFQMLAFPVCVALPVERQEGGVLSYWLYFYSFLLFLYPIYRRKTCVRPNKDKPRMIFTANSTPLSEA